MERRSKGMSEPMTALTDFLLAAVAGALAALLLAPTEMGGATRKMWGAALAATALAALLGGIFHGFHGQLEAVRARRLWWVTLLLSALPPSLLLAAAALGLERGPARSFLLLLAPLKLALTSVLVWRRGNFAVVAYDAGISLLLILLLTLWELGTERAGSEGWWIGAGVMVALVGAVAQQARWRPTPRLNHNDIFHLAQTIACYLLYRGALHA